MKSANEKNCVFSATTRRKAGGFSSRKRLKITLTGALRKFLDGQE